MFLQIALTIIGAFLSVVLTKILIQNGKQLGVLAEDHKAIMEALERISEALGVSKKVKGTVG